MNFFEIFFSKLKLASKQFETFKQFMIIKLAKVLTHPSPDAMKAVEIDIFKPNPWSQTRRLNFLKYLKRYFFNIFITIFNEVTILFQPVCGNDGNTYRTECQLRQYSCRIQREVVIVGYGPCTGTLERSPGYEKALRNWHCCHFSLICG
jgi:hypothetical protein